MLLSSKWEKIEVLATNSLADQTFIATPAIAGGSLYLRSQTRCTASDSEGETFLLLVHLYTIVR